MPARTPPDALGAAVSAQDRLSVCDLILAVLLRTSRPCSPDEITALIAGAGVETPDRQTLTQAIEGELMAATSSQEPTAFDLRDRGGNRWNLSPAFTAWLMNRGLPCLRGRMPACPVGAANDD
jgi:hypothetical protein